MALRKQFVWLYPETQERNFARLFLRHLRDLNMELLRKLRERQLLRVDAPEETWSEDLELATELAVVWWLMRVREFTTEVRKHFTAVSMFNDRQFRRAIAQIYGVKLPQSQTLGYNFADEVTPANLAARIMGEAADVTRMEPYVELLRKNFEASATSKFEEIGRVFISTTARDIRHKVQNGVPVNEIIADIKQRAETMEAGALQTARAEIAAVNAILSQERQQSAGIKEYIWHTRRDDRVRPTHKAKEGTRQRWDKAPSDTGHPGHDYMCRCWAEPVR